MNRSAAPKLTCRSFKFLKQQKADLEELSRQGYNWALEELQQVRQAEREKNHLAYERFKAKRAPEELRAKWRESKTAQRVVAAAARAEAEERKRRDEELATKAAALAAEAERARKAREPIAESGTDIELEILRIPPNPRMVICRYRAISGERACIVRVGRNMNFRRGMKLVVKVPANGIEAQPWPYDGLLPRRPGHW
jgi:plasmid stabilization system protein ParE